MKAALIAALLIVPVAATAQTAIMQAGEHDGFTRLVIDLPQASDWRLGRTDDGYELDVKQDGLRFDLTNVFRVIPRTRLGAVWSDPATGKLRIGVACACYAVSSQYRPDIIVIDLRDGQPKAASPQELTLDGRPMPTLAAQSAPKMRPRSAPNRAGAVPETGFGRAQTQPSPDQRVNGGPRLAMVSAGSMPLGLRVVPQVGADRPGVPFRFPTDPAPRRDLSAMRARLVQEMGRAATAGVIDIDDPQFPGSRQNAKTASSGAPGGGASNLSVDGLPGFDAVAVNDIRPGLTASGTTCIADSSLNLRSWADDRPFDVQMAEARQQLVGEFDRPDPRQVEDLVRLYLYFGFGAEARNTVNAFALDDSDIPLWLTMARIVDQDPGPAPGPLADQAACKGLSAVWASLADPGLAGSPMLDRAAVAAGFSDFPVHLRRHLGPGLAEAFLAAGDVTTAQAIRDAIRRAPGDAGPGTELIDAKLDQQRGNAAEAETRLSEVSRENGPVAAQALISLVDMRIAAGEPIDAGTITQLAALARENRGGATEPGLVRAEILARGSAGDFETAFALAKARNGNAEADLWQLLSISGADSVLLSHAVLSETAAVPSVDDGTRQRIGDRLLTLGFPDEALRWFPTNGNELSLARAELQRGDARAALRGLAGLSGPGTDQTRAEALAQLGDQAAAAAAYARAGDADAQSAALWRAREWTASALTPPEPARVAIRTLSPGSLPPKPDPAAPLAQGRALLDDSAAARNAILALLQATPAPVAGQP